MVDTAVIVHCCSDDIVQWSACVANTEYITAVSGKRIICILMIYET